MIKFVVGGQIKKNDIANLIEKIGGDKVSVQIKPDIQAAKDVKEGKADYYVGACETGGGGALSMAMALLTRDKCETISMPGKPPKKDNVSKAVEAGKVAFGFTHNHYEDAIAMLLDELL